MPDVLTEAAGRLRLRGLDGAALERVLGSYRLVFEMAEGRNGEAISWLLTYGGPGARPRQEGSRVRVEHEVTAIRVPCEDGYELHVPERGVVLRRGPGRVETAGDLAFSAELLRKALRQIITRSEQRQGMAQLHASAVADDSGGVLAFVGPRGAGKTTTLTTALVRRGLHLVSNDRLCLAGRTPHGPLVYGWPTDYTVGHGTLRALGLWDRVPEHVRDTSSKMHFSPERYARLCGAELRPRGTLRTVAFMRLDLDRDDVELGARDEAGAISEVVRRHLFTVEEDEDHPDWLELGGDLVPGAELDHVGARLRGVRFVTFSIGRSVDRIAGGLERLADEGGGSR